jgi:hypothetical protein
MFPPDSLGIVKVLALLPLELLLHIDQCSPRLAARFVKPLLKSATFSDCLNQELKLQSIFPAA